MSGLSDPFVLASAAVVVFSLAALGWFWLSRLTGEARLVAAAALVVVVSPLARHSSIIWGQFFVREGQFDEVRGAALGLTIVSLVFLGAGIALAWSDLFSGKGVAAMKKGMSVLPLYPVLLVLAAGGLVVGLASGNDLRQLASHTLNLVQPALQCAFAFALIRSLSRRNAERLVESLMLVFAVAGLLNCAFSLFVFGSLTSAAGGPLSAVVIAYAAARFRMEDLADKAKALMWGTLLLVGLAVLIFSFKRAAWAGGGLALAVLLGWMAVSADWRVLAARQGAALAAGSLILAIGVVGLFAGASSQALIQAALLDRAQSFRMDEIDAREVEVDYALQDLALQPPLAWLAGRGSGAQYFHPNYGYTYAQIHITPVTILQRHGIVGLILFAAALAATAWQAVEAMVRVNNWISRAAVGYLISSVVFTFSAFTLTWDHVLAVMLACSLALAVPGEAGKAAESPAPEGASPA